MYGLNIPDPNARQMVSQQLRAHLARLAQTGQYHNSLLQIIDGSLAKLDSAAMHTIMNAIYQSMGGSVNSPVQLIQFDQRIADIAGGAVMAIYNDLVQQAAQLQQQQQQQAMQYGGGMAPGGIVGMSTGASPVIGGSNVFSTYDDGRGSVAVPQQQQQQPAAPIIEAPQPQYQAAAQPQIPGLKIGEATDSVLSSSGLIRHEGEGAFTLLNEQSWGISPEFGYFTVESVKECSPAEIVRWSTVKAHRPFVGVVEAYETVRRKTESYLMDPTIQWFVKLDYDEMMVSDIPYDRISPIHQKLTELYQTQGWKSCREFLGEQVVRVYDLYQKMLVEEINTRLAVSHHHRSLANPRKSMASIDTLRDLEELFAIPGCEKLCSTAKYRQSIERLISSAFATIFAGSAGQPNNKDAVTSMLLDPEKHAGDIVKCDEFRFAIPKRIEENNTARTIWYTDRDLHAIPVKTPEADKFFEKLKEKSVFAVRRTVCVTNYMQNAMFNELRDQAPYIIRSELINPVEVMLHASVPDLGDVASLMVISRKTGEIALINSYVGLTLDGYLTIKY